MPTSASSTAPGWSASGELRGQIVERAGQRPGVGRAGRSRRLRHPYPHARRCRRGGRADGRPDHRRLVLNAELNRTRLGARPLGCCVKPRASILSDRLCREPDPQSASNLQHGVEPGLRPRRQCLVKALPTKTRVLRDLRHPFGSSDIAQRQEQKVRVICLEDGGHVLRATGAGPHDAPRIRSQATTTVRAASGAVPSIRSSISLTAAAALWR